MDDTLKLALMGVFFGLVGNVAATFYWSVSASPKVALSQNQWVMGLFASAVFAIAILIAILDALKIIK